MKRFSAIAALTAAAMLFGPAGASRAGEEKPPAEIRAVETYVPYEEFLKLAKDPDATVMSLKEYRDLATLALARQGAWKDVVLPPVNAALAEAVYTGKAQEGAARFDVTFKVTVTGDEWARCDLGALPPGAGRITLDDGPAWIVVDQKRPYLLVKGRGPHTGTLSFSTGLATKEDVQQLGVPLLHAAVSVLRLEVSGRAAAADCPYPVDAVYDEPRNVTVFSLGLGKGDKVAFQWRRKYHAEKSDVLLLAEQRISYLLEPANPSFRWQARVTVARRKAEELVFSEPPGGRVLRLTGPNVHSWNREGDSVRVLLDRPLMGDVVLQAEGLVTAAGGSFALGCPQLKDAWQDTRYLALLGLDESRVTVEQAVGYRELAVNETPMPEIAGGRPSRLFLAEQGGPKTAVRVAAEPPTFDVQAALSLLISEKHAVLRGVWSVQPERGRVYSVLLNVPPPWSVVGLQERGTKHGISAGMTKVGDAEAWLITLDDAADAAQPLELYMALTLRDSEWAQGDWQARALNFAAPAVAGARRSTTHLGITVHPAINLALGAMPAWRTEPAGALRSVGILSEAATRDGAADATLRAGLVTETAGAEVKLDLARREPRGDYDCVSHVLTTEREVWVRADIRLAIVDRAVDELIVELPQEAAGPKQPLYIRSADMKEVAPGPKENQRRVRFNQPWLGVRMMRIEYRVELATQKAASDAGVVAEGQAQPVPDIRVLGSLDSRRRIVFQSAGVVELRVEPGPGLAPLPLEYIPGFAMAWRAGRPLSAYTFTLSGVPGTYSTKVYRPSPTLGNVARTVDISTVLDRSGVSRTRTSFLLLSAREQYLPVRLPDGADLVALTVGERSVKPVKGQSGGIVLVPLPPGSSAQVEFVYERHGGGLGSTGTWREDGPELVGIPVGLTMWQFYHPREYAVRVADGNVEPEAAREPEFFALSFWRSIVRGQWPRWTAWEHLPRPRPIAPQQTAQIAQQAMADQSQGRAQQQQLKAQETVSNSADANQMGGLAIPEGVLLKTGKLGGVPTVALAYRDRGYSRFAARVVFFLAVVIGLWLARRPSKRALVHYVLWGLAIGTVLPPALDWQSPLLAVPFCEGLSLVALGLVAGLVWHGVRSMARKARTASAQAAAPAAASLLLATFLFGGAMQTAAGESETVLVPYPKEGFPAVDGTPDKTKVYVPKSIFLDLMNKANPEKARPGVDAPTMEDRRNLARAKGVAVSGGNDAQRLIDGKTDGYGWTNWAAGQAFVVTLPKAEWVDTVRLFLLDKPDRFARYKVEVSDDGKVFTPVADWTEGEYRGWQTERFARRRVQAVRLTGTYDSGTDGRFSVAELEVLSAATIVPYALGNARYELTLIEPPPGDPLRKAPESYRGTGTLEVATYNPDGWARLPLDFGPTQLVALTVNGQPASVAVENGVPFVALRGAGKHVLSMELQGPLTLGGGRAFLQARFACGSATRVAVTLPADVELDKKVLPPGAWVTKDGEAKTQCCEVDVGGAAGVVLAWHSSDIGGKGTSQVAARCYTQLQLGPDGYGIFCAERLTVDGPPLDQFSHRVAGNWQVSTVTAPELAEWTVSGEGENRRLRLWFQKPVSQALVQISGWAPLATESAQVAVVVLENVTRQEGFIGLVHGGGRRFTARSPEGLRRASSQELAAMFSLPAESLPDRIYQYLEPPVKNSVSAELDPAQVSIETQAVGVIKPDRLLACVRSRYTATGRTPLRHEVDLPAGWQVRKVQGNAIRAWAVVQNGAASRLVVDFATRAATGTEVIWSAEQPLALPPAGPLALELPQPRAAGDAKTTEVFDWVLAADRALALSQDPATTMQSNPLERAPAWVRPEETEEYHFAYRSIKAGTRLVVGVARRGSIGAATVVSFVYSAEDHVQINARCRYRIEQAGMARFRLKLPAGAKLVSLAARDLRGHEVAAQADGTLVTAVMQSPVVGEQTIDLAYRLPRTPGQDVEAVPVGVEDSEIQKVEHFVGVLRDEYGLVSALPKAGLQPLNDGEKLPFLPANVSTGALATAYAATGPEWALVLRRSEVESGGGPEAIVTLCVLKTVLAADGGVRSVATYTLRNRTLQFMRIGMPPEAKLWGVLVDGQPVTASQTSQQGRTVLQIPIPRMALTDLPISVTVVYEEARVELPATLRSFTPQAPEVLDRKQMPVVETYWKVYVPEGYETTRTGGSVKDAAESVLVAGMIKTSVDETKQMLTIAETSKSESQRRGALRNLAKLGQELSDKVTVLQSMSQQVDVDEQRRVGRDEWGKQMEGNKAVQQEAGEYQKKLQARGKEIEEAVTGGAGLEEQRAFMDKYHFLDNRWRGGSLYAKPKAAPVQPPRGEVSARELNTLQPFAGFRKGELPAAPAARVTQDLRQIPEEGGMPEAREHQVGIELGATDLRVEEKGTTLTFRLVEEQPTLTLRLRSVSSTWHWAAVGALLALAAGAAVALRMRTRAE